LTPLVDLISRLTGLPEGLPELGSAILVTPREPTSNSVVALLLDARTGSPALVVKLPRFPDAEAAIVREAATLRTIQTRRATATVPSVLALESLQGQMILVESALVGETISPSELRRHPRRSADDVLRWLLDLQEPELEPFRFDALVELPLRRFASALPPQAPERLLVEQTLEAVEELRRATLPSIVEHGDLSHPNLIRLRDGRVGVVDWELAEVAGLPGTDLCFFLGYVATIVRRARSPRQLAAAFDEAFAAPDGWARPPLVTYARRVGLEPSLLSALLVLTWARYAARFASRVEGAAAEVTDSRVGIAALRESPHRVLWEHALRTQPHFGDGT
jgi:aminoglycoside phosphotransferase